MVLSSTQWGCEFLLVLLTSPLIDSVIRSTPSPSEGDLWSVSVYFCSGSLFWSSSMGRVVDQLLTLMTRPPPLLLIWGILLMLHVSLSCFLGVLMRMNVDGTLCGR